MGSPIVLAVGTPAPSPVTGPGITGMVVRHADMPSAYVARRNVDVWLPPSYGKDPAKRYPVLYMHDGQNLFDPATSYGNVDWAVDEVMTSLIEKGVVREAIVVGVWNTPKRRDEYMPQRPVQGKIKFNVPGAEDLDAADIVSDRYLEFLVKELKPFIDATYRTLPGQADTIVMGSSMGGLISQYAMSQYPDVFGGAGCVSTHWPAGNGIALDDFAAHLPDPATHKYWFDYGTATLDALYTSRTRSGPTRSCARPATSKARTGSRANSKVPSIPRKRGGCAWINRWCFCSATDRFPKEHKQCSACSAGSRRLSSSCSRCLRPRWGSRCRCRSRCSAGSSSTKYGLDLHDIGLVWAAGPLAGIVGQVLIGIMSDEVWLWGGRRRPFMIIGGTLAVD